MAITVDQANVGVNTSPGTTSSANMTTTSTVAAGGYIVLAVGYFGSVEFLSSITGGGLSWTIQTDSHYTGGLANAIATARAPSGLASGTTITAAVPVLAGGWTFGAMSLLDVKTSGEVEASGPGTTPPTADGNPWSSGSRAISAGSVLVGASRVENITGGNAPTGPGLEAWETTDLVNQFGAAMVYRIESSAGSYAVGGTWTGTGTPSATQWIALLAAPAGGTPDTRPRRYQIRRRRATSW